MAKAVLISIQPHWCELIASGKKTLEVRKNRAETRRSWGTSKAIPLTLSGKRFFD